MHRDVPPGVPIPRKQHVHVIVEREIVAEVGKVPRIMPCGPDQIVQAKARKQNAAAPAAANVLKDEGQPHDRHVPDVEHGRPRDHGALIDPLHLSGGKMVIGDRLRIRREVRGTGVDTRRSRVDRQVAADVPRHPTLLKIGERVVHDAASHARVVVHRIPDEHSALVEELGVAHGIASVVLPLVLSAAPAASRPDARRR